MSATRRLPKHGEPAFWDCDQCDAGGIYAGQTQRQNLIEARRAAIEHGDEYGHSGRVGLIVYWLVRA